MSMALRIFHAAFSRAGSDQAHPKPVERRYHQHIPGIVFVGFTIVVALGAINSQNNLLFMALGLSLGALVVSGIISGASLMGVRLRREMPASASCFRAMDITYRVTNANRLFGSLGVTVEEALPTHMRSKARSGVAWWKFRLAAGDQLTPRAQTPAAFVIAIPPRRSVVVRARAIPLRRGWMTLESVRATTTFPFGLSRKSVRFEQESSVLVRPGVLELRPGITQGLLAHQAPGQRVSRRAGQGEEFYGIREYTPGDPPRRIAWRPSARRASTGGSLVIRQTHAPAPPVYWVVLRLDAGAGPAANERAIVLAASLLAVLLNAHAAAGLQILNARLDHPGPGETGGQTPNEAESPPRVEPRAGPAQFTNLLTCLALVRAHGVVAGMAAPWKGGAIIGVHAGSIEASAIPGASRHWSGEDLGKLVDPARAGGAMAMLERSLLHDGGAFA